VWVWCSGTFYYADGNIYEGEFKDDIKHGQGKLIINPGQLARWGSGQTGSGR
jgi:hypothetical protein